MGLDTLAEAIRGRARTHGVEVTGFVARLEREAGKGDGPGEVVIVPTEGEAREMTRITVALDPTSYLEAIQAHTDGTTVRVFGTLDKKGRRWELADARDFAPARGRRGLRRRLSFCGGRRRRSMP